MNAYKYQEKQGFNKKHKDDASTEHDEDTTSEEHNVTDYDTAPDGTGDDEAHDALAAEYAEDVTCDDEAHDASADDTADEQAENATIGVAEKEKQNSTTLDEQGIELGSKPQTNDEEQATIAHSRTEEVK